MVSIKKIQNWFLCVHTANRLDIDSLVSNVYRVNIVYIVYRVNSNFFSLVQMLCLVFYSHDKNLPVKIWIGWILTYEFET